MSKADRKPLVILHCDEAGDIPVVYIDGDVEVLSVCDYAPDDRVYRFSQRGILADLIESIRGERIGHNGDGSAPEAQLKKLIADVDGRAHLTLVEEWAMSKADRAKKREQRKAERASLPRPDTKPRACGREQTSVAATSSEAVRPTPERMSHGEVVLPRGPGRKDAPARVAVPDCIAALCIEPRKLTQAQENAARAYEELRWRVRLDLGLSQGRSCLDIGPVGHDDGEGDAELAAEWRRVRTKLGLPAIAVLDAVVMEGRWPRDLTAFRKALDELC